MRRQGSIWGMGASAFSASGFQIADGRLLSEAPAASGGGRTLRCHDLGMILAWHGNGVCDGGHSADVMNKG
jgi:hypothetical protein